MKKLTIIIISIFMVFVTCGCGDASAPTHIDSGSANAGVSSVPEVIGSQEIKPADEPAVKDPVANTIDKQQPFEEEVAEIFDSFMNGKNNITLGELKENQDPLPNSVFSEIDYYKTFSYSADKVYELTFYDDGQNVDYDDWPPMYITMNIKDFNMTKDEIIDYCVSLGGDNYYTEDNIEMIPLVSPPGTFLQIMFNGDEYFIAGMSSL